MRNDLILHNTIGDIVMPCRRVWRAVIDLLNWYHYGGTLCDKLYIMQLKEREGMEGGGVFIYQWWLESIKLRTDF